MSADIIPLDATAARPMNLVESYVGKHRRVPREVIVARFWANFRKSDGCWTWGGPVSAYGYGMIRTGGRGAHVYAHRLSYELHRGEIPPKMFVCHTCDVRTCVNPNHLFLGTHDDNRRDMIAKGRNARGERAGGAKLTEAQAVEIIEALGRGEGAASLARRYRVNRGAITGIKRGHNWKHLPRPQSMTAPHTRRAS